MNATRAPSLKAHALRWLAQREHSRAELRRKLLRRVAADASKAPAAGEDTGGAGGAANDDDAAGRAGEVDALLDWLVANRYLDERRFVESRVHARAERFGNRRIAAELSQHGVALDEAAAASLRDSEWRRARAVWSHRFDAAPSSAAERAKQGRFLAARGFSPDVIHRLLRGGPHGEPD